MSSWSAAANQISKDAEKILSQEVLLFQGELLRNWAVDTGTSRRAWLLKRENTYKYVFTNDVSYSPYVWLANRPNVTKVDNIVWWHGGGGQPLFDKAQKRLTERLQHEYAS